MIYNVEMAADGSTRQVEGATLAEVMDRLDVPFRRISIGSGLQEIVLLEPLNDLPATWTKADLPQSPSGDSVSLVRLLVRNGLVAGETGLNSLTVDPGSLLSWAGTVGRALFAELLLPPPEGPAGDEAGETGCDCEPKEEPVLDRPHVPEYAWTPAQLATLWSYGLVPCGGDDILLLVTPLRWLPDCVVDSDSLSELLSAPTAIYALAPDPDRHRELALAWWDRFWECDEHQYAARRVEPAAAAAEPKPPSHSLAYRLIQEAFGVILNREELFVSGRMVTVMPGNGLFLRSLCYYLAATFDAAEGQARLCIERQANWTNPAVITFGPDGREKARSLLFLGVGPGPWPACEVLTLLSVLAGLSLRTWEEEGETVLPWLDHQCLRVKAKRSLAGVYGPVLDLRWSVGTGGFLALEQPVRRQTAKAPSVLGRLVTASADWQGRYRFALLAVGIALLLFGMLAPSQHGLPSGIALVWTGMVCCLEPQRREPGIWMLSGLALAATLFVSVCYLLGIARDLRPDIPWSTLAEEWLMLLIFLAPNLYLWDRTRASLRRDRAVRQAIQPKG